ncbi:MAG: DUF2277 domain-containing protein [Chloroflexi bacterium]|nr:DUF2277 domain-containing protein [Chloroflexota bacterium]
MCRSIKILRTEEEIAENEDIRAAALQFVRKITGIRKPSIADSDAFEAAIAEIVVASHDLLASMGPKAPRRTVRA